MDISRYFLADWACGHDHLPVHYERAYYELAERALNKLLFSEVDKVDRLDELAFAEKLERNITSESGIDSWKQYILSASTEFRVNDVIDSLIATFSLEELEKYRFEVARLYRWAALESDYVNNIGIPLEERQAGAVERFEEFLEV